MSSFGALTSESPLALGEYLLKFRPKAGSASWFTLVTSESQSQEPSLTLQLQNWGAKVGEEPSWAQAHGHSEGERDHAEPAKRPVHGHQVFTAQPAATRQPGVGIKKAEPLQAPEGN